MLFFELPYWLMTFAAVAATGIAGYALYLRVNRGRELVLAEADCRETRLIESGESMRRDCDD